VGVYLRQISLQRSKKPFFKWGGEFIYVKLAFKGQKKAPSPNGEAAELEGCGVRLFYDPECSAKIGVAGVGGATYSEKLLIA
jgi:hypothetical protein